MRTVLTGAGGYIGTHILRELLQDGHDVTALVRSPGNLGPFAAHPRLSVVETDLEDSARVAQALSGHDVCVHAALIWGEPGSELDLRDTAVAAKLFDAAGRAGLSRCITLSSAAVHRPFSGQMGEGDRLVTEDLYGATKAAGELFLRAACATHQMTGVALRPGPVVGPPAFAAGSFRSPDALVQMVRAATAGRPIEVVQGEGRQFSDVSQLARAIRLLSRVEDPHPTYLCVDRDPIAWERVAALAVACLGSTSAVRILPSARRGPVPHFRTDRIDGLLGGPTDSVEALVAHVQQLVGSL